MYEYARYEHKGIEVRIVQDEDPSNPMKDWDAMPTIVHWHRRYDLGDDYPEDFPHPFEEREAAEAALREKYGCTMILPVYLYDHSGITLSMTPFSCPWDSGQVGFVLLSAEALRIGWGDHPHPEGDDLEAVLRNGVEVFDQYVTGEVYGYIVAEDDEHESCWGFFGDIEHVKSEANAVAEHIAAERERKAEVTRKTMAVWRD